MVASENEQTIARLKEELKQIKEEYRQKESKLLASQNKVQEKARALEVRNRELSESLEKLRIEEQSLRKRLNASLRPGALVIACFIIALIGSLNKLVLVNLDETRFQVSTQ